MNLPHPSQISSSDNNYSPTSDMIQEQGYVDFGIDSAGSKRGIQDISIVSRIPHLIRAR